MFPLHQPITDLGGKVALVAAGAQGLAFQMARALGEAGARIMLSDLHATDLELACAELQACGVDARWVAADATLEAGMNRWVTETLQRMGDIDILVTNTFAHSALLSQRVVQLSMLGRRSGRIIQFANASDTAHQDALTHATRALAAQWGPYNIRVNTMCHRDFQNEGVGGPMGSSGEVAALQSLTVLMASDVGQYLNGQCLMVHDDPH